MFVLFYATKLGGNSVTQSDTVKHWIAGGFVDECCHTKPGMNGLNLNVKNLILFKPLLIRVLYCFLSIVEGNPASTQALSQAHSYKCHMYIHCPKLYLESRLCSRAPDLYIQLSTGDLHLHASQEDQRQHIYLNPNSLTFSRNLVFFLYSVLWLKASFNSQLIQKADIPPFLSFIHTTVQNQVLCILSTKIVLLRCTLPTL